MLLSGPRSPSVLRERKVQRECKAETHEEKEGKGEGLVDEVPEVASSPSGDVLFRVPVLSQKQRSSRTSSGQFGENALSGREVHQPQRRAGNHHLALSAASSLARGVWSIRRCANVPDLPRPEAPPGGLLCELSFAEPTLGDTSRECPTSLGELADMVGWMEGE